jgi:hypothetical protein
MWPFPSHLDSCINRDHFASATGTVTVRVTGTVTVTATVPGTMAQPEWTPSQTRMPRPPVNSLAVQFNLKFIYAPDSVRRSRRSP